MIALRGIIHKDDQDRWKWSGLWTFGSLPPQVGRDLDSLTVKLPNVRPLEYVWEKAYSAASTEIPSLVLQPNQDDMDDDVAHGDDGNNDKDDDAMNKPDEALTTATKEITETKTTNGDALEEQTTEIQGGDEETTASAIEAATTTKDIPNLASVQDPPKADDTFDAGENQATTTCNQLNSQQEQSSDLVSGTFDGAVLSNSAETGSEQIKRGDTPPPGRAITFSTMLPGDPAYTEASTVMDCPPDGGWDGFFENIIRGRKADNRVSESISLFWNATPPKDARSTFMEQDGDAPCIEPGQIHVRGMGSNQFGVFELLGTFDTTTKVLELQRMYVSTSDPVPPKPSPSRKVTPVRKSIASRAYSTRKRKLSWQRRSTLSDDEDEIVGMKRHVGPSKKRPRVSSITPTSADKAGLPETTNQTKPPAILVLPGTGTYPKKPSPVASAATVVPGPKKRGGSSQANNRAVVNNKPSSLTSPDDVTLPAVGDPDEARWRAAHFLYYQRNDPSTDENAVATSFVVYEGEFLHGKCIRHGRGVCLYNNGTLYEGEWKRNREHGKGTLMTADRRWIVYSGEWERGRMHGQGIYYFRPGESGLFPPAATTTTNNTKTQSKEAVVPRYEGEFKENCRHGNGKYFLPDGSTYEGEWRENLMSGRGMFVWPDGSSYIGQWKDGKRHGQGLLQAADKFTYDGMWVNNAMEGRGIAVYPGGQRYEGLWANGRRDGRGTIQFVNGAVYEGRFREDAIEGQGTMKMTSTAKVPIDDNGELKEGWMIPISFQSDIGRIHQKAGFTIGGE